MTQQNLEKIYLQSQQSLWPDIMDCVQQKIKEEEEKKKKEKEELKKTKKKQKLNSKEEEKKITQQWKEMKNKKKSSKIQAAKAIRIKLYPTKKQTEILKKWIATARWTYNQCLNGVKEKKMKKQKKFLRANFINNDNFSENNKWAKETPYDIRDEAMNDLLKAYKTNFAKGEEHKFEIRYKSKKQDQESIVIHSKHWKKAGVFYTSFFGNEPIRAAEPLPEKLDYDSR
jgi:hypothetical protein